MTRLFDIIVSVICIILLLPFALIIAIFISLDSRGGVLYKQIRVGRNGRDFKLYKFRSMSIYADKSGLLTVGNRDTRITKVGHFLRKYKIDEMPQIINVIKGDMSLVGPRPEVRKYVELYTEDQKKVLTVRPGITDMASIVYYDENEMLKKAENPEDTYVNDILPDKIRLNMFYIDNASFLNYLGILAKTFSRILLKSDK